MTQVSSIVSGVASLGLLAGVVSGFVYLLLHGIRWAGRVRAALQQDEERRKASARCVSCGRAFNASSAPPVICSVCGQRACFDLPCSRPAPIGWNCVVCHVKRAVESSTDQGTPGEEDQKRSSATGDSGLDRDMIKVREFIEKIVENIIGGSLDGVPVGKLSQHHAYNNIFGKYHEQLCQAISHLVYSLHLSVPNKSEPAPEAASSAHTALSHLIEKIAEEAARLPNLNHSSPQQHTSSRNAPLHDKSYEDILSTAILNKIIQNYQRKNGYSPERRDSNSNVVNSQFNGVHRQDALDDHDSDWSDLSGTPDDPFNIKVEEHVEEVTTTYDSSSDDAHAVHDDIDEPLTTSRRVPFPEYGVDIVEGMADGDDLSDNESSTTDVISNPSTWEENWLFQKKKQKMRSGHNPVPVPMLVPNPSQEFRALIGGVDADDISDLSECSDSVLEEVMTEVTNDNTDMEIIDVLNEDTVVYEEEVLDAEFNSRSETTDDTNVEEEQATAEDTNSTQTSTSDRLEEDTTASEEAKDEEVVDKLNDSQPPSIGEKDRDFSVEFDAALQIDKPPVPRPRTLEIGVANEHPELDEEDDDKPMICSVAEREKAKWNNPVEMKNNPYTPENIAKRSLSRSLIHLNGLGSNDSVDYAAELDNINDSRTATPERKYSRDYYIKASRSPTGEQTRVSDSPLSFRSETSLEDRKIDDRVEIWDDMSQVPEKRNVVDIPKLEDTKKAYLASKPPIPGRSKSFPRSQVSSDELPLEPVSEIINRLTCSVSETRERPNCQEKVFDEVDHIRRASLKTKEISSQENSVLKTKKPIKLVHSLTARSIPRDFREGLKISPRNSKSERIAEMYSADDDSLVKLNFDVKGKKTFWENLAKQKT